MDRPVRAAVVIPREFADRLRAGEPTAVQVLIDGSDSNTATIAQGYALAIVNQLRRDAPRRRPVERRAPPIEVASRVWYNPELKSVNFIVPGRHRRHHDDRRRHPDRALASSRRRSAARSSRSWCRRSVRSR